MFFFCFVLKKLTEAQQRAQHVARKVVAQNLSLLAPAIPLDLTTMSGSGTFDTRMLERYSASMLHWNLSFMTH
jgi:hypothetical protein